MHVRHPTAKQEINNISQTVNLVPSYAILTRKPPVFVSVCLSLYPLIRIFALICLLIFHKAVSENIISPTRQIFK
jgi:hypothetical protein